MLLPQIYGNSTFLFMLFLLGHIFNNAGKSTIEGGDVSVNNFEKLIIEDRKERQQPQFRGNFIEYLHILIKEPGETILSHERIYRLITNPSMKTIKTEEDARLRRIYGNDVIKQYLFFKDSFFGIDATLMKIVRYFHSAAMKGEESRQVLYSL